MKYYLDLSTAQWPQNTMVPMSLKLFLTFFFDDTTSPRLNSIIEIIRKALLQIFFLKLNLFSDFCRKFHKGESQIPGCPTEHSVIHWNVVVGKIYPTQHRSYDIHSSPINKVSLITIWEATCHNLSAPFSNVYYSATPFGVVNTIII